MDKKSSFGARELIFKEGTPATSLYIVKRGEVLCLKSSKDRLIPIFLASEGDIIGESAIIKDLAYTYSTITLSEAELVPVPSLSFVEVFSEAPDWLKGLTTTMIMRFQSTSNLIAENRIIHSSIISEEKFSPSIEVEFKKLLS